jgi:hypothetical protein
MITPANGTEAGSGADLRQPPPDGAALLLDPLDPNRIPPDQWDLLGVRTDTPYTEAERQYSAAVQENLEELLQGRRARLPLMRRYHEDPPRIDVLRAPGNINRAELRLLMVERILVSTIAFIRDISPGGCVFQCVEDGQLLETQHFTTKYPHIIIERVDAFAEPSRMPLYTEWRLRRVQNQRAETQINRWLDAANLALSAFKTFRGEK